jgi:integrase
MSPRVHKIARGGPSVRILKREQTKDGKDYAAWVVYWREGGRPRSTSRSTQEAARQLGEQIAFRLGRGAGPQKIITGAELDEYLKTREICERAGGTPLEAARFYAAEWEKKKIIKITVPDLIKEFLVAKDQDDCSDLYLDDARLRLKKFAKVFDVEVNSISTRQIDDYLRGLKLSNRSRDNVHTILKSLFSFARSRGYLNMSERTAPEARKRVKLKPVKIGILTPDEFQKVLPLATRKTLPAFVLGGFCGIRQAEICRMDWSAIDFKRKLITVNADLAKTGRRRLVPLHDAAAAWLAPIAKDSEKVIEYSSPINLSSVMREIYQKAGVKNTHNCLRHSAASYRLAITNNAPKVALELGTSVQKLKDNYRQLVTKEDAQKWYAIYPAIDMLPIAGDPGNPIDGLISETVKPHRKIQEKVDE